MKISEVIKNLKIILDRHGDLEVVYSEDEEGNCFNKIAYPPSVGRYSSNEFDPDPTDDKVNAVCIN